MPMQQDSNTRVEILKPTSRRLIEVLEEGNYSSVFILCDENTHQCCWSKLTEWHPSYFNEQNLIVLAAGEASKKLASAEVIWKHLVEGGADRHSVLLNLGGGMITDLGAFAASLYQRGIDFIHLPTSLLAMVDAAIGGKAGVDFDNLKNQIGIFSQAKAILVYPDFLQSLPESEYLSGMAEVYKHALIRDRELWKRLKKTEGNRLEDKMIELSVQIKQSVVEADPLEKSSRKILNFGHTVGHAIESYFLGIQKPIPHGNAVVVGMICEVYLSMIQNKVDLADFDDVVETLLSKFPLLIWNQSAEDSLIQLMRKDKKSRSGKVKMVLLNGIGTASYDHEVSESEILEALNFYRTL